MKFRVTFKTPDAVDFDSMIEEAEREVLRLHGIEDDHVDPENEELVDQYNELAHGMVGFTTRWATQRERVTLEFDTDAGTCTVVKP